MLIGKRTPVFGRKKILHAHFAEDGIENILQDSTPAAEIFEEDVPDWRDLLEEATTATSASTEDFREKGGYLTDEQLCISGEITLEEYLSKHSKSMSSKKEIPHEDLIPQRSVAEEYVPFRETQLWSMEAWQEGRDALNHVELKEEIARLEQDLQSFITAIQHSANDRRMAAGNMWRLLIHTKLARDDFRLRSRMHTSWVLQNRAQINWDEYIKDRILTEEEIDLFGEVAPTCRVFEEAQNEDTPEEEAITQSERRTVLENPIELEEGACDIEEWTLWPTLVDDKTIELQQTSYRKHSEVIEAIDVAELGDHSERTEIVEQEDKSSTNEEYNQLDFDWGMPTSQQPPNLENSARTARRTSIEDGEPA